MKKVLLLEDEEMLGKMYKKYLDDAGFKTEWTKTTEKIGEIAEKQQPDFILLDNTVQGEDVTGVDLIEPLKGICPKAKIYVVSNSDDPTMKTLAKKAGADDIILKIDMSPDELVKFLKK